MKNGYYITMGAVGASYIYYPKTDKLYGVVEKGALENQSEYKRMSYTSAKGLYGVFSLLILFLFYYTPYVRLLFSLELWHCIVATIISCFVYRTTVIQKKIENFSKIKLVEIPFKETTAGHYNAIKSHTKIIFSINIIGYMIIIYCWIFKFEIINEIESVAIPLIFLIFALFVIAGIFFAVSEPIGRLKLICRIHREKRKQKSD